MRLRAAHPVALGLVGVATVLHPAWSRADDLAVAFRNAVVLPATAIDQNGQSFPVTGLSGLTFAGPAVPPADGAWRFWAVLDNADTLVELRVVLNASGSITSASVLRGLRLSALRDHEDIALAPGGVSVFIAEENTPRVHEHRLSDGALVRSLDTPPVFLSRRDNFGFEALTLRTVASPGCAPDRELWTANEEALTVDGPLSTPSTGTVVRLLRYCVPAEHAMPPGGPGTQLAYVTEPIHAGPISGARSGLVALVGLPSGRTIALERSFGFDIFAPFRSRMFEIDLATGSDVSTFTDGLAGQTYAPVFKRPLYQGNQTNMEGLALGPPLSGGGRSLLGIVDDADPISLNRLVAFVVTGPTEAPCPPDFDGNGVVNSTDVSTFVSAWFADLTAGTFVTDWTADGVVNSTDVSEFINAYFAAEPTCLG
jgi:hypothetical protein